MAHTAFAKEVVERAQVIADTPVYIDYPELDRRYPDAKFIYLQRPFERWSESIRRLLKSVRKQYLNDSAFFEKDIMRCFNEAFPGFTRPIVYEDDYLSSCLDNHKKKLLEYFSGREQKLLICDLESPDIAQQLKQSCFDNFGTRDDIDFPHVNKHRRIAYWDSVEHQNKIASK